MPEKPHKHVHVLPQKTNPSVEVKIGGEVMTSMEIDEASCQRSENGDIVIAWKNNAGKKLTPGDFLQALVYAKQIKPTGPDYDHLPAGVYTALIKHGCVPLKKGTVVNDAQDIEGYFVSTDPDDAVQGIIEAIHGDAWTADAHDCAGDPGKNEDGDRTVKVLFRRVH